MGNKYIQRKVKKSQQLARLREHARKMTENKKANRFSKHNTSDKITAPSVQTPEQCDSENKRIESPLSFLNLDDQQCRTTNLLEKNETEQYVGTSDGITPAQLEDSAVGLTEKKQSELLLHDQHLTTTMSPNKPETINISRKRQHDDNLEHSLEISEDDEPLPYEVEIDNNDNVINSSVSGHRIIDINVFFNRLLEISQHKSLFECGLHTIQLVSEKQSGLTSVFSFSCLLCRKEFTVQNSSEDLNKMAVSGMLTAGCGNAQLNQLSACLDLPAMTDYRYKKAQDEVFDEWEVTAWEEMRKAGEREKESALKEGRVTKDGIPIIDVILDGCWCKRSYKTNYAALSGAAAIIGRRFGQVLYMAVKNKYCCICARAEKRKEEAKQHECFKNFCGASTSMESAIIAEGFKTSIEMHGLIYGRYIADGDSSTYAKILDTRPYPSITVEKIGCRNHILRNFCNKMQMLKTETAYNLAERKLLTTEKIMSTRKYICDAIDYHGSQDNKSEGTTNLHKDVTISVCHAFGSHEECNKNICSDQTVNDIKNIFNSQLWQRIRHLVGNVASQARSLIENVDSNIVERFNGVVAKFVGGKRVNYALKRSYQARVAGAVVSFNSDKISTTVHKNIHHRSPLAKIKKYEETVENKREYNRTKKRKKNRNLVCRKINFDYGENVNKPDMDNETYELAKSNFLRNLEKTEEERKEIEKRTILQSDSGEWLELRRNLLTASNFGKVVKRIRTNSCASIVKNMLYRPNIDHVASINHGKKNEKVALEQLARLINKEIQGCGLFIDETYSFLGATPDGITDDMVIEIKCPIAPFKIGIEAAIQDGKMHFWRRDKKTGQVQVNQKSDWYFQAQGQMHICKKDKCLVAVWYGEDKIKTQIINKDEKFWKEKMEPKLLSFYFDCLLPELVDPRYTRNRTIRDPEYVINKNRDKDTNKENKTCGGNVSDEKLNENERHDLFQENSEIVIDISNF